MDLDSGGIEEALRTLGDVLDSRDLKFEIIAVGAECPSDIRDWDPPIEPISID